LGQDLVCGSPSAVDKSIAGILSLEAHCSMDSGLVVTLNQVMNAVSRGLAKIT
jgi:hypothetical protein